MAVQEEQLGCKYRNFYAGMLVVMVLTWGQILAEAEVEVLHLRMLMETMAARTGALPEVPEPEMEVTVDANGQSGNDGTAAGWRRRRAWRTNGPTGGAGADGHVTVTYTTSLISFTSTGFYTIPPGVTQIKVECWGAGGGGSTITSTGARGGGGGGGAYAAGILTVVPGDAYSVTVGTGGSPSTAGGASSFGTTMVVACRRKRWN